MIKDFNELKKEKFELMELFGDTLVIFTSIRISRELIPEGLYAYDLRHDDECTGDICEIKPFVLVNHWGTVISKVPIEMGEHGYRLMDDNDYSYGTGGCLTLKDYVEKTDDELMNEWNSMMKAQAEWVAAHG